MTKRTGRAALPYFLHKVCFSRQIQFMILSSFRWQTARSDPSPCLTSGQRVSAVSVLSFRFSFSRRPSSALTQLSQPKNPLEKFYFCLLRLAFWFLVTHSLLRIHAEQLYAPFFFCFFLQCAFPIPTYFSKAVSDCCLSFTFWPFWSSLILRDARRSHSTAAGEVVNRSFPVREAMGRLGLIDSPHQLTPPPPPPRFPWLISVASSSNAEACLKKNKNF